MFKESVEALGLDRAPLISGPVTITFCTSMARLKAKFPALGHLTVTFS